MREPNADVVEQLRQLLGDKGVRNQPDKIFSADKLAAT
jgi:hypothetical protein